RRDVDREIEEEPFHRRRLVQEPVLELRQRRHALGVHPAPEPSLQRSRRVLAEVEAVAPEHRLEQELDLERRELAALRVLPDDRGRYRPLGGGHHAALGQWYSQTRISDRS